uniref:Uncharacterized protein n=1 Tax=Picea sitchensis TaxID=3332 RepID=A9NY52_PICSI|nr:unknown [Picea sitchensis]
MFGGVLLNKKLWASIIGLGAIGNDEETWIEISSCNVISPVWRKCSGFFLSMNAKFP